MAKFRMNEFQSHMAAMQKCIDDFKADYAAEQAAAASDDGERLERQDQPGVQDNPSAFPGQPKAMDGRPTLAKPKGLVAIEPTPAVRALRNLPGYRRLSENAAPSLPKSPDLFAK